MKLAFRSCALLLGCVGLCSSPVFAADNKSSEKKPVPGLGLGGSLEDQMTGYWAPDAKAMAKKLREQIGGDEGAEAILPMLEAALANMAVLVKKGEVTVHVMGQVQTSTYKVIKSDPITKTLTMTVKDDNGESKGTAKIDGDKLTLTRGADGADEIVLNRIKKEEYEKRKAAAGQPPIPPGLE